MRRFAPVALAAALLSAPTLGCSAEPAPPPVDKAFGEKVRAYLLEHPEVISEAMTALQVREEAKTAAATKTAIAVNRPKIERDPRDPVAGNRDAKITVTQFFDYRCPYCKVAGGRIQGFIDKHPNARFVFKEFPILSEASDKAARLALAADRQGKYLPVHVGFLAAPNLTEPLMDDILRKAGVDLVRAKADAQSPAVDRQIVEAQALARTLGVNGTPAFIVGDTLSNGWAPEELDALIAAQAKAKG